MEIKDQNIKKRYPEDTNLGLESNLSKLSLELLATKLANHRHTGIDDTKKLSTSAVNQVAVGSGTKSSSGTLSITCGFTPKMIKIVAIVTLTSARAQSTGFATPENPDGYCSLVYGSGANYAFKADNIASNIIFLNNTSDSDFAQAVVSSFDATGFTLNFYTCSGVIYFNWEAYS